MIGNGYGWGDLIYDHWPEREFFFLDAMMGLLPAVKNAAKNARHTARKALMRDPRFEKITEQTGRTASRFRKVGEVEQRELDVDGPPTPALRISR